jgi:uncharacterized phage protein (TIGR02218 family)
VRAIDASLQADLDAGATTLCRCWRLARADGLVQGFTDHDADIAFGGTDYRAATGFTASAIESSLGLNVDGLDVAGALASGSLTELELAKGFWDNAAVTIFLVDWQAPSRRTILFSGSIGEVSRSGSGFVAELRSLSHALNQPTGRLYGRLCDADLGDARCGVDLDDPDFRADGAVVEVRSMKRFTTTGLNGYPAGRFTRGRLLWTSGANAGAAMEVSRHAKPDEIIIELFEDMAAAPAAGDGFTVTAGCDKTAKTCRRVFGNVVNFRGFPDIPGNDWLLSPPSKQDKKRRRRRME